MCNVQFTGGCSNSYGAWVNFDNIFKNNYLIFVEMFFWNVFCVEIS